MRQRYLVYSGVAFVAYSLVAPLLKVAMVELPSTVAVFLSNSIMLLILGVILLSRKQSPFSYLRHSKGRYTLVTGVVLAVALLTYYRALALGPVSVVVPIFGLYIAVSSFIGFLLLDEVMTPRKLAGIGSGVLAIIFISL